MLLVSKGLVECRAGSKEFGLERVLQVLQEREFHDAKEICSSVLEAVQTFAGKRAPENDITALALMRT